jgi:outer membrane autotransporter protein
VFGAALGYNNNETDVNGGQGKLSTDGYSGSLYGTWYQGDAWFADAVLTWGKNSYDLSRRIRYQITGAGGAVSSVDQLASASPDGTQTQFALSAGRDFNFGAWNIGPYARATATRIDFDAYSESLSAPSAAGGGLGMAVDSRKLKSLEGVLGAKATYTMSTSWGVLMPHAQVEWLHEFEDNPEAIISHFANDPTATPIVIDAEQVDVDYLNLGLGLSGVFANGRSAFVYYERRAGQRDYSQDSLAVGVRIEF